MDSSFFFDRICDLPSFDDIPTINGLPKGCTWGLWDRDGVRDELGTLNLLTSDVVKQARQEISEGISISLNLPLDKPSIPVFQRQTLAHTIVDNGTLGSPMSFDDILLFNTQSGSQWDGLRHVVHHKSGQLYNWVSRGEISKTDKLGLNKWHERGGIVGRGILIDYVAYAKRHNINYSPVEYHTISYKELEEAANEQRVVFRQGDILIVRTGLTKWYNECASTIERDAWFSNPRKQGTGVYPSPDTVAWVWNHHFSAVAGDALAWEPIPYPKNSISFHQYLLALWGTPIGELWDLELLAETCARLERYSFFFTSCPLNVPGGVASPPNALAIF